MSSQRPVALPPAFAISRRQLLPDGDLVAWAGRIVAAGRCWLQVRERELGDRRLLALLQELRSALPAHSLVVTNGRPDLALLAQLDGVHLPATGIPAARAREMLGRRALVGRSTHSLEEVARAASEGADYVVFGPVFEPLSKHSSLPATGLERLAQAASLPIPVFALGGVTIGRLARIAETGASGVAGITAFSDPAAALDLIRLANRLFPKQD